MIRDEQDEMDELELDDFDGEGLEAVEDEGTDYLAGMWGRYNFRGTRSSWGSSTKLAEDTVVAHGMVQSLVNAFATDGRYNVSFSEGVGTAGTDMNTKNVIITPAPIADPTLDPQRAGLVLTGLAVHEISHPRYGKRTAEAVARIFIGNPTADRLSNLLDDVRIENRFANEFPGYAGVFAPTLEYVADATLKANGGKKVRLHPVTEPVNTAVASIRYPGIVDWDAASESDIAEAAWWNDWANRGARQDSPKRHVDFIREALLHIAALKAAAQPKPQPQASEKGEQGKESQGQKVEQSGTAANDTTDTKAEAASDDTEDTESGAGEGGDANDTAPEMSDDELNQATRNADETERKDQLPSCAGSEAVDQAARNNGTNRDDIKELKDEAQEFVDQARNQESDGHGLKVDVARSLKGLTHGRSSYGRSAMAIRYIANAILASRTGNTAVTGYQKRGRLDGRSLDRLAYGDTRVFESRKAPAPGKYNIWVMVDCSGSMSGWPINQAAQVANAIAVASLGTPATRVSVWGWSSPFRRSAGAYGGAARVWTTGQDTDECFRLAGLQLGGTPDATITGWADRAIREESSSSETPVLIICSDGNGDSTMTARIAEARKHGVQVYGVSFGDDLREKDLLTRYGKGNYVKFAGSIERTARGLGDLFAKITSTKKDGAR